MNKQNKYHVVIGTGPLGMAVMDELLTQGIRVRMVSRKGSGQLPPGAEWFSADVSNPVQSKTACQGASVVYHCAMPPYTEWPKSFPPLTQGILTGAAYNKAKLVMGDNLYAHGRPTARPQHP